MTCVKEIFLLSRTSEYFRSVVVLATLLYFFFLVTDVKINQHERVFYASLNFLNTVLAVLQIKHYGSLHIIP